jgi:hypothetical protein
MTVTARVRQRGGTIVTGHLSGRGSLPLCLLAAVVGAALTGCVAARPLTIHPRGFLEPADYSVLQTHAQTRSFRTAPEEPPTPTWVYYLKEGFDGSRISTLSLPDFQTVDPNVDSKFLKALTDKVAETLLARGVVSRVNRSGQGPADARLVGAIMKYKPISAGERAASILVGGARDAACVLEAKLVDGRGEAVLGAILVNTLRFAVGLIALNPSSYRAEDDIPEFLAKVFQEIKAGKTGGVAEGGLFKGWVMMTPALRE